ncbi:hypothetical protein [Caudoviricetes sp.]|nr:hypothetical protein [Caudoviricetes sp.]
MGNSKKDEKVANFIQDLDDGMNVNAAAKTIKTGYGLKIGDTAPSINMVRVTGKTGLTAGSSISVLHGINAAKIIGIQAVVNPAATTVILAGADTFSVSADATNVIIKLSSNADASLFNKDFSILITYIV